MIIAGDIGGTKTNLALFDEKKGFDSYLHLVTYPSREYSDLQTLVRHYLQECKDLYDSATLHMGSFAIAGPVVGGVCKAVNLPWVVDARKLVTALQIPKVYVINDLEANAWAIEILSPENIVELHAGRGEHSGNRAVISPGTGLGEAALYWDGKKYHPFASEGGHCEFGPKDAVQLKLCDYLQAQFGHVSYERVLSGPGLCNIYNFFKKVMQYTESKWLIEEMARENPSKVITQNAMNQKSDICIETVNLFISILGAEAGNCALKFMAKGGIYLGGGILPKILPKLQESLFLDAFIEKGRLQTLLETIPIHVILDDKASLKGAAHYGKTKMKDEG